MLEKLPSQLRLSELQRHYLSRMLLARAKYSFYRLLFPNDFNQLSNEVVSQQLPVEFEPGSYLIVEHVFGAAEDTAIITKRNILIYTRTPNQHPYLRAAAERIWGFLSQIAGEEIEQVEEDELQYLPEDFVERDVITQTSVTLSIDGLLKGFEVVEETEADGTVKLSKQPINEDVFAGYNYIEEKEDFLKHVFGHSNQDWINCLEPREYALPAHVGASIVELVSAELLKKFDAEASRAFYFKGCDPMRSHVLYTVSAEANVQMWSQYEIAQRNGVITMNYCDLLRCSPAKQNDETDINNELTLLASNEASRFGSYVQLNIDLNHSAPRITYRVLEKQGNPFQEVLMQDSYVGAIEPGDVIPPSVMCALAKLGIEILNVEVNEDYSLN
jgi:hypothetical protein